MRPIEERFWERVEISEDCWNWTAGTNSNGYGKLWLNGKLIQAHRFAYSLVHGVIPEGMLICHRCDNPLCVRISHLFLGTQLDNIRDAVAKGRKAKGERHGMSKLVENDVYEIRRLASLGVKQHLLAKMWQVHFSNISNIISRRNWRHI